MAYANDKELDEFIAISKKDGIEYKDREEARQSANNLVQLAELTLDIYREEKVRKDRLEKEPDGFTIIGDGRSCSLCLRNVAGDIWYDKWGMKCLDCHEAFKKKIVPGYVFRDYHNEKHITASSLQSMMDVRAQTIKKLVRQGKLKPRVVRGNGTLVFLKKENPNLIKVIEDDKKVGVT